jgi:hypothetical protein
MRNQRLALKLGLGMALAAALWLSSVQQANAQFGMGTGPGYYRAPQGMNPQALMFAAYRNMLSAYARYGGSPYGSGLSGGFPVLGGPYGGNGMPGLYGGIGYRFPGSFGGPGGIFNMGGTALFSGSIIDIGPTGGIFNMGGTVLFSPGSMINNSGTIMNMGGNMMMPGYGMNFGNIINSGGNLMMPAYLWNFGNTVNLGGNMMAPVGFGGLSGGFGSGAVNFGNMMNVGGNMMMPGYLLNFGNTMNFGGNMMMPGYVLNYGNMMNMGGNMMMPGGFGGGFGVPGVRP